MKKALIIPAVIVVLLVGCRPEENREQLKAVNRSLEYANSILQSANTLDYEDIRLKLKDPTIAKYVSEWEPKVNQVKLNADNLKELLKNVRSELITQSDSFKKEYVSVVKQLYDANGVGGQLLNKLVEFKDSFPAMIYPGKDSTTQLNRKYLNSFLKDIPLLRGYDSLSADQQRSYKTKWLEESFGRSSSLMATIMLNKIESDVLATEKKLVEFCKIHAYGCGLVIYDNFSVVASLSSSYVKAGQSIELTAGVGEFGSNINPRIIIDGSEVKINDDAVAVYKFVAAGKPGKHTIPVRVEFIKPDGSKALMLTNREYIIAEN